MFGLISNELRPNRFSPDIDVNSESYHVDFGRYAISEGYNQQYNDWLNQYITNVNFFFGNQWISKEDLETFLMNTSDQSRNRIKVVRNIMLPIGSQYIGNSIVMDINVRAAASSTKAKSRMESKLEELTMLTEEANEMPKGIGDIIKEKTGIGNTPKETTTLFNNLWQDEYVKIVNAILTHVSEVNDFKGMQGDVAKYLMLSGLSLMQYEEWNGEFVWNLLQPNFFGFDHTAKKRDLSDALFMCYMKPMGSSEIYEKWTVPSETQKLIESNVSDNSNTWCENGRVPVYKVYWKDSISYQYGYVMDQFGYPVLEKINYIEEGAEKPLYTDKDVISYDKLNETQRRVLNGRSKTKNAKVKKWVDIVRFIDFIPSEILASGNDKNTRGDVVLDYGIMPFQDTQYYKFASCKFPIKCTTWHYLDGFVFTPMSELISPQRMINRYESVKENLVNTSLPAVLAYDSTMIDDEKSLLSNVYQGKPVKLEARGVGINNAITSTKSTLDTGAISSYEGMSLGMEQLAGRITGVNESILGQAQGSEQLVGVTAMQIQRGSLIQEPFYSGIVNLFEQAYQSTADVGKRVYAQNERELDIAVGSDGVEVVKVTQDIATEDFRIFIHRQVASEQQKMIANQQLIQFLQMGLIDAESYADLYNRSTPDEVAAAIRKNIKMKNLLAQSTMKEESQLAEQAQTEARNQQEIDLMREVDERNATLASNAMKKEATLGAAETAATGKLLTKQMELEHQRNNPQPPQK